MVGGFCLLSKCACSENTLIGTVVGVCVLLFCLDVKQLGSPTDMHTVGSRQLASEPAVAWGSRSISSQQDQSSRPVLSLMRTHTHKLWVMPLAAALLGRCEVHAWDIYTGHWGKKSQSIEHRPGWENSLWFQYDALLFKFLPTATSCEVTVNQQLEVAGGIVPYSCRKLTGN